MNLVNYRKTSGLRRWEDRFLRGKEFIQAIRDPERRSLFKEQLTELIIRFASPNPYYNEWLPYDLEKEMEFRRFATQVDPEKMIARLISAMGLARDDCYLVSYQSLARHTEEGCYNLVFPFLTDLARLWKISGDPYAERYSVIGECFLNTYWDKVKSGTQRFYWRMPGERIRQDLASHRVLGWVAQRWRDLERRADPVDGIRFHLMPVAMAYSHHSARNALCKVKLMGALPLIYEQIGFALLAMPELIEDNGRPAICTIGDLGISRNSDTPACALFRRRQEIVELTTRCNKVILTRTVYPACLPA